VARFESYRGFLFGSLNADVVPLVEHLGESAKIIDMIVDQSPEGLEVLRGSSYIYEGNWKLQAENGADGYHVSSVHWNYAATQNQRKQREAGDEIKTMSAGGWAKQGGGFYSFENGHMLLWTRWANPKTARLRAPRRAGRRLRRGPRRLDDRELAQPVPVPERVPDGPVQLADPRARPISVDKTEITIYCIAPKGESAEARARRIRQYEDFFNVSGMATPDDLEEFRSCQTATTAAPAGTTCPAARSTGSKGRRGAKRSASTAAVGRAHRGRRPVRAAAQVLAGDHDQGAEGRTATDPRGGRAMTCMNRARLLYREARYLDDAAGTTGWSCTPRRDVLDAVLGRRRQLTEDPQREISLIYYANRRPGRPRLPHQDRALQRDDPGHPHLAQHQQHRGLEQDEAAQVRFNWHTLSFRYKTTDSYFGTSFYTLDCAASSR
jgi:phenylpropionate dioxygenase-like ring-hydroxylating dioxygenase large terminal subunit/3-phenylpropionate/cinnamic acid dioxygenase small subunit